MKKLLLLTACIAAAVSAHAAQAWTLTDTLLDGKVPETFLHNHDMAFQMRGSLRADMPRGEDPSVHFRMDNAGTSRAESARTGRSTTSSARASTPTSAPIHLTTCWNP